MGMLFKNVNVIHYTCVKHAGRIRRDQKIGKHYLPT